MCVSRHTIPGDTKEDSSESQSTSAQVALSLAVILYVATVNNL